MFLTRAVRAAVPSELQSSHPLASYAFPGVPPKAWIVVPASSAKAVRFTPSDVGTQSRAPELIGQWIAEKFDLRPAAIVERLDLRRPIYQKTAAYGHFGRTDPDFTWESTDIGREAAGRIAASG